jgi:5'-nucleotidase
MQKKPTFLLTNDDGIQAPGLKYLWKALKDHSDLLVAAPASEQSGVGLALTLREPLHIEQIVWHDQSSAWQISGTPADCVRLATSVISEKKPDIVLSGINKGSNSGRNLLYSGTVGGVIEAAMRNLPGIAFSCEEYENPNYEQFVQYILPIAQYLLDHPLPKGSFLNVTFPSVPAQEVKGCKMARQGMGYFKEDPLKRLHPEGRPYYWMGGKWDHHDEHEDSDVYLLKQGYITVVPVQIHELTDHISLEKRKDHFETLFQL